MYRGKERNHYPDGYNRVSALMLNLVPSDELPQIHLSSFRLVSASDFDSGTVSYFINIDYTVIVASSTTARQYTGSTSHA
jgi:hypothetical protein